MESRFFFTALVLFILFSSSCIALESVENVKPQITAAFEEKVVLMSAYLLNKDASQEYPVTIVSSQDDRTFTFVPGKALSNGRYVFTLYAADLVGNMQSYVYEFEVYVPGTRIFLVEPNSIGFANSTSFRVVVYSSRPSVCKFTGIAVSSFDDVRLKYFDETGNLSESRYVNDHTIASYSVETDFPRRLFVACKDDLGRENFADFLMHSDLTPPTLTGVLFSPSPIVEYPPTGDLFSVLKVSASEPVQCRFTQDGNATYSVMAPFDGFDLESLDAFLESNEQVVFFPGNYLKETFTFYVQCEDRAGWLSSKATRPLTIDMSEGLVIRVVSPPASSRNTSVFLNLTTNRRSYCLYKSSDSGDPASFTDPAARLSSSFENLAVQHYKKLPGARASGTHTISIHCEVPEGVGLEAMSADKDYTYIIDTVPPSAPRVNATTPVCVKALSAEFVANDSQSGIASYLWSVGPSGKALLANGSVDSGKVSVSKTNSGEDLNLSGALQYVFSVVAIDGAGNVGPAGLSNPIKFDETGFTCDKTPPTVKLVKSISGDSVSIECYDEQSNCSSQGSLYGTSYDTPCNATLYFTNPTFLPLFRDTMVCWSIRDNAGNVNTGSQVVGFNVTGALNLSSPAAACQGGIDKDGDGYGEKCMLGPDCDDTNKDISVGCVNGCIRDMDGDGYGVGCRNGNDCNDNSKNLTTSCPNGCISDNDGDEFGLGCSNGPDCKGDDSSFTTNCPNGCIDDNDGDSYGLGCAVDFDCNGEDVSKMKDCGNDCISDNDGDGSGFACMDGLDCNGFSNVFSADCANGCIVDEDGDGYGFACMKGLDCNGAHYFSYRDCSNGCISDNDGDGYGWKCGNGADCNDTDPYVNLDCTQTTDCKYDHDGDGYGLGCEPGADCDDYDFLVFENCTQNCTYDIDCNGLPDEWQEEYFNSTVCNDTALCGPEADPDGDGVSNIEEYRRDSDPMNKDEVVLPSEAPSLSRDEDSDGMPDACERMYGLNANDPFDADKDSDSDGLDNSFECNFHEASCVNGLNPRSPDTDNDGYSDKEEYDAETDPCDPESHPSGWLILLIVMLVGMLAEFGSTGYLIYKKYYIPLVSPPPKPAAVPRPAVAAARQAGAPLPGAAHHVPRHFAPHRPSGPAMSRERFDEEMKKRSQERERILGVFGAKREIPRPTRVMEDIARKPAETRRVAVARQELPKQEAARLAKVVGEDYVDKIASLTREQADYFGKLASITKKKEVPLEEDQVTKLASITKKYSEDDTKKEELEKAFRKSDMDKLDEFLSSGKRAETFIKEYEAKDKAGGDSFDELSQMGGGKGGVDALSELSKGKRRDVMDELNEMSSKKAKETALSKMEQLSSIDSKEEIFKAFSRMSKDRHVDKNVFEVLFSYLLKSGKITKQDVSNMIFRLQEQGVLDKKDVAEVFFNLGINR
jgi:hypothetical protein